MFQLCITHIWYFVIWVSLSWFQASHFMYRSSLLWYITQRRFVVKYRRFGTTSKGQVVQGPWKGNIGCSETSVINCQSSLHNILKERGFRSLFLNISIWKKLFTTKTTKTFILGFYSTVRYVNWRIKNQLDATYYFIVLLIGSTCFGHYYAHHQELKTMMLIITMVVSFLVCCYVGG